MACGSRFLLTHALLMTSSHSKAGVLVLTVFFCAGVVPYVIVGMLVQKTRNNAWGLPHRTFWSKVPGLVRDGCRFTCACMLRSKVASILSMDQRYESL